MKSHLFLIACLIGLFAKAQTNQIVKRTCGTDAPPKEWDQWFNKQVEEYKNSAVFKESNSANYTIPVVFHVIHGGQNQGTFPNISQTQINSQIAILNNDFAGTGLNVGNFSGTNFSQSLISNCNVTFCLAEKDPSGNTLAQKGIDRINYNANGWSDPTSFMNTTALTGYINNTIKPASIWDPTRYLNIWISDVNASVGLLGYATFPANSTLGGFSPSTLGTATTDGVWCWSRAIGNTGTTQTPFDKGRTATHEVGHWLGLRHIWADDNCGDDFCNDTPTQQAANTGCPSYPHVTCSNGPNGDMFMNFMDYCNDACLYMFTPDQRTRIQTAMANSPFRSQLTASSATLCGAAPPVSCLDTLTSVSTNGQLFSYRRANATASDPGCPTAPGAAGYVMGTNCYGDKEKAEFVSHALYSSLNSPVITGVIVLFFQYGNLGTNGTGNVSMNIYQGTSATVQPGILLGTKIENLSTIAASTKTVKVSYCGDPNLAFNVPLMMPYKFTFSAPVPAPASGGFFASVVLPTNVGDTVSIIDENNPSSNTAWEKWSNNTWHDMKTAWNSPTNYKLCILPVMDCAVGVQEKTLRQSSISLFPNPTNGKLNLYADFDGDKVLKVNVYNLYGQQVYAREVTLSNQSLLEIDMSGKQEGVYMVELLNGNEKVTKKFILQK